MDYVIAGIAAFIFGIVSAISGGGAGLVLTPLLLLLGFDPKTVLSSAKVGGLSLNFSTITKFYKHEHLLDRKLMPIFTVIAVVASLIGTQIIIQGSNELLEAMVIGAVILVVPFAILSQRAHPEGKEVSVLRRNVGLFVYFIFVVLNASLGSGVGVIALFVLMIIAGFSPLKANASKRWVGLISMAISTIILGINGLIDWKLGATLAVSYFAAGRIGAHIAIQKGNVFVRNAMNVVAVLMVLSLLLR